MSGSANRGDFFARINEMGEAIVVSLGDMGLVWLVYLTAAAGFIAVFWPLTRFRRFPWLGWMLRALLIALLCTPWYANSDGRVLAPALMVAALDAITIGQDAAARALIPLGVSMAGAVLLSNIIYFRLRARRRRLDEIHRY